eukprot:1145039-Pelagomonas_calceolata.AAC.7
MCPCLTPEGPLLELLPGVSRRRKNKKKWVWHRRECHSLSDQNSIRPAGEGACATLQWTRGHFGDWVVGFENGCRSCKCTRSINYCKRLDRKKQLPKESSGFKCYKRAGFSLNAQNCCAHRQTSVATAVRENCWRELPLYSHAGSAAVTKCHKCEALVALALLLMDMQS